MQKRVVVFARFEHYVTTVTAIAAAGSTARNKFFASKG
jgi:hypothetical protein